MSSASHEGSSVNSFLPMAIRGELSFPQASPANLICGTARGARSFSIDFTRVDGAFICTALKHGT